MRIVGVVLAAVLAGGCFLAQAQDNQKARQTRPAADVIKPDYADLAYGPHARNVLDLWLAKTDRPAPLLIFIHGGGFVSGDKGRASTTFIKRALAAGVSFAAINYRYRTTAPVQDVMHDCARAVQYLRSRAGEFRIDKTRVAAMGGSAGAGTSLWLAFHDDMADPKSADPVLRESTRLTAAAASATQATYDMLRWPEILGQSAALLGGGLAEAAAFYGVKPEELESPKGKKIRADVDMLGMISKDDPPVYMVSSKRFEKIDSRGAVLHTPLHAWAVKKACDAAGVLAIVKVVDDSERRGADADYLAFLLERLGAKER
jgi:acetyl esterase/lipase